HLAPSDEAARLGGDEFATLLPAKDAETRAKVMCEQIASIFETPFTPDMHLSDSVGIAIYPHHAETAAELLQKSDMA
ncbi:diguanylate cyclase domain-containing protein, partial [Rhizobium leguminosarum]|uniref:diguanylate cyclase domain-containing protein n=1 Tax=Rhizobium leguminosarum TaxID=384 RepID=UPI003F977644